VVLEVFPILGKVNICIHVIALSVRETDARVMAKKLSFYPPLCCTHSIGLIDPKFVLQNLLCGLITEAVCQYQILNSGEDLLYFESDK